MKHCIGDMFDSFPAFTVWLITTNAFIKKTGELVMGRGAAAQTVRLWPEMPRLFGNIITHMNTYGVVIAADLGDDRHIGAFQVKHYWGDEATIDLIEHSCMMLNKMALSMPEHTFRLNYPGIGNGRLRIDQVNPILEAYLTAPNIEVWRFR